jgi:hypothetical protein
MATETGEKFTVGSNAGSDDFIAIAKEVSENDPGYPRDETVQKQLSLTGSVKKYILLIIIVLSAAFIYTNRAFFAIDKCLDAGGSWDYEAGTCRNSEMQ